MAGEKFFWQTLSIIICLWVLSKLLGLIVMLFILVVCVILAVGITWWQLRKRKKKRS